MQKSKARYKDLSHVFGNETSENRENNSGRKQQTLKNSKS